MRRDVRSSAETSHSNCHSERSEGGANLSMYFMKQVDARPDVRSLTETSLGYMP